MKTEIKDALEMGKLIKLIQSETDINQYSRELITYLDMLHNRIRTLEMYMEQMYDITKKFI